jgi:hypothetical protein
MSMADLALYGLLAAAGITVLFVVTYGVLAVSIVLLHLLGLRLPRRLRLWPSWIKLLKFIHIFTAGCWLGAAVSLVTVTLYTSRGLQAPHAVATMGKIMVDVDNLVIIPMALTNVFSGVLLALSSAHNFRLPWVLAKGAGGVWALVVGWFLVTPRIHAVAERTAEAAKSAIAMDALGLFAPSYYVLGALQFLILVAMLGLSVFKPWGRDGIVEQDLP